MSRESNVVSIYDLSKDQICSRAMGYLKTIGIGLICLVLSLLLTQWVLHLSFSAEQKQGFHYLLGIGGVLSLLLSLSLLVVVVSYAKDLQREVSLWRNRPTD